MRRYAIVLIASGLLACGLPSGVRLGSPTRTVAKEAPPGTFSPTTTFAFKATFSSWAGVGDERSAGLRAELEKGISKAERELERDTFISNPGLANRAAPPAYSIAVDVGSIDRTGPFPKVRGAMKVVDAAGNVLEDAAIEAFISQPSGDVEAPLLFELGYQIGVYMVCRTTSPPTTCQ